MMNDEYKAKAKRLADLASDHYTEVHLNDIDHPFLGNALDEMDMLIKYLRVNYWYGKTQEEEKALR
jgi:hypothetical protein